MNIKLKKVTYTLLTVSAIAPMLATTVQATEKNQLGGPISYKTNNKNGDKNNESISQEEVVDKNNFLDYFETNGDASYDKTQGIITLTTDRQHEVGTTTLKSKIDLSKSFVIKGSVFLGEHSGADGIGVFWHQGKPGQLGTYGNGFGIGGIQNAFGFKLDTYFNGSPNDQANPDNSAITPPIGTSSSSFAFGSFYSTDKSGVVNSYGGNDAPGQQISVPSGRWNDVVYDYNGNTHVLTVEYNDGGKVITWKKDISDFSSNFSDGYNLGLTASTGSEHNLQQFKLDSFTFSTEKCKVTAHYVDEDGNTIADDEILTGSLDEDYQTSQKKISGYKFVKVDGDKTGKFTSEDQEVTYIYQKEQGKVITHYIDEDGNTIAPDVSDEGRVGDAYTTKAITIDGYKLDQSKLPENAVGKYSDGLINVTYVYKKIDSQPIVNGTVVTHFIDKKTNKEISKPVTQTGRENDSYTTSAISINGYSLDQSELPSNASGKYNNGVINVLYYYNKVASNPEQNGTVVTHFVDENGNKLRNDEIIKGRVNDAYATNPISIDGYALDESKLPNNSIGKYINGNIEVTYVYSKVDSNPLENGSVTVHYVDEDTNEEISESEVKLGRVNDTYSTNAISIDGYALDESKLPENSYGKFTTNNIDVTYLYKSIKDIPEENGQVITHFVDEDGIKIKKDQVVRGRVNDAYKTSADFIDGYALDESKLPNNSYGKYINGNIEVTYVYKKMNLDNIENGNVVIHFIDEKGNKLENDINMSGRIGDPYVSNPLSIDNYQLIQEKLPKNRNGNFTEKDISITYVYRKVGTNLNEETHSKIKNKLPQTGENNTHNIILSSLGALIVIISSYFFKGLNRKYK